LFRSGEHYFFLYLKLRITLNQRMLHFLMQGFSSYVPAGQATSSTNYIYVGASRPLGSWGTAWPEEVPDEVWLNGVPVDWSWMWVNGYTIGSEPNNPAVESVLILYWNDQGSHVIGNCDANITRPYICEFA
jgi:hypothetical protein